jgi:hypothetical protein
LFDAAHYVTPQDLWRHPDDANSAIIKHDDSFDPPLGESSGSDLPKRVDIALEEAMDLAECKNVSWPDAHGDNGVKQVDGLEEHVLDGDNRCVFTEIESSVSRAIQQRSRDFQGIGLGL